MGKPKILLVEDNVSILEINGDALRMEGYEVFSTETAGGAKEIFERERPDLLILDIMLPDGSGVELCREIRGTSETPVLFLSALGDNSQVMSGFKAGGDDYLVKPYHLNELCARVKALLRRSEKKAQAPSEKLELGPLTIDLVSQRAYFEDEDLLLQPKELGLLVMLARKSPGYLTTEELYAGVWGSSGNDDLRTVRVHLSNLRKKLSSAHNSPFYITYGHKKGYRLMNRILKSGV